MMNGEKMISGVNVRMIEWSGEELKEKESKEELIDDDELMESFLITICDTNHLMMIERIVESSEHELKM